MAAPAWMRVVAWVSLAAAFVAGAAMVHDIFVRGHRQQMRIMAEM